MYGITLFLLASLISIGSCSFVDLFNEWSKIKEEPSVGRGPFRIRILFLRMCEGSYKKDPDVWVNASVNIKEVDDDYDVDIEVIYPENVTLHKLTGELWGKTYNNSAKRLMHISYVKPCKYSMFNEMLKYLKIYPPCTILKGNYKFTYLKTTKLFTNIVKYSIFMRVVAKLEYFSEKGQYGCNIAMADIVQK